MLAFLLGFIKKGKILNSMSIKGTFLWKYLYIYICRTKYFRENVNNFWAMVCGNGNSRMIFAESNGSNGFAKIGRNAWTNFAKHRQTFRTFTSNFATLSATKSSLVRFLACVRGQSARH